MPYFNFERYLLECFILQDSNDSGSNTSGMSLYLYLYLYLVFYSHCSNSKYTYHTYHIYSCIYTAVDLQFYKSTWTQVQYILLIYSLLEARSRHLQHVLLGVYSRSRYLDTLSRPWGIFHAQRQSLFAAYLILMDLTCSCSCLVSSIGASFGTWRLSTPSWYSHSIPSTFEFSGRRTLLETLPKYRSLDL